MKNLKRLIITAFSGLLFIAFTGCNNSEAASSQEVDLKKNEQLKERVFEQILNDEELFTDFTKKMRADRQAMQWMQENRPMMQEFYGRRQMQDMMRRNPEMRRNMMQMMQSDTTFMPRTPQMRQQMMQNMMRMMEKDTSRMNPEIREQMLENMRRMMERDTVMQNRMQQMMQGNHMMRNN